MVSNVKSSTCGIWGTICHARREVDIIDELLPQVQALPKADKLRLMQFLVFELAWEEGVALFQPDADYPIWTPYNAFDAASTLLSALYDQN
jgi:hypothetical protein